MGNSKNFGWKLSRYIFNKNFNFNRQNIINVCGEKNIIDAYKKISGWKDYNTTPLIELKKLSDNLKLKNIFYKDESKRFHLKSFKALGGAYAVERVKEGKKKYYCFYGDCWKSWTFCGVGCAETWIEM